MTAHNRQGWRMLSFLLVVLTMISLFLPPVTALAADEEIMVASPADYFGEVEETETGKNNTTFYFYGYSELPEEQIQAYVNEMEKLGLVSDRPSIGQTVNLESKGKTKIQIVWQSGEKYDGGYVRVNIVRPYVAAAPTGKYTPAAEKEDAVIILSPEHYFGEVDRVERGETSTTLYFDGFRENPKKEMQEYVEAFKAAGFTGFIIARSGGDREAAMEFDDTECLWLIWDESEKCIRLEMLNSLPAEEEADTESSLPERMKQFFGTPKNVEYNEEEEYLIYDFTFTAYPSSEMKSFLKGLNACGLSEGNRSVSSSGTSLQKVYWKEETCLLIWWLPKTEKLEITLYRDAAQKAGLFDEGDIPKPEPKPTEPTPTEPKPTEPAPTKPTIPTTDSPKAVTNIIKSIFGTPYKTDYKEDRYETRMYFRASSEPKTAFANFRSKMESLGLKVRSGSFSSNGGRKEIGAKAEGGTPAKAIWKKKEGIIEVTIKWEYVQKAGVFDSGDIPVPAETEPPSPNPEDKVRCNVCFGSDKCSKCKGTGEVAKSLHGKPGVTVMQTCNRCWGTKTCDSCDKGWVDP